jgi:hypothetical protein
VFTENQVTGLANVEILQFLHHIDLIAHRYAKPPQRHHQCHTKTITLLAYILYGPICYVCNNFKYKI